MEWCCSPSTSVKRAAVLGPLEGAREELLHGGVVEKDAAQHGHVPQVVAPTEVIEHAGAPPLWDFASVDKRATQVDQEGLRNGRVKFPDELGAAGEGDLEDGEEAGGAQADVEGDSCPSHILSIKPGVPREDDTPDAEGRSCAHIDPSAYRLAVKRSVLCRHDGGGDEERDARVVNAGEGGDQLHVGNGVHGVPDGAADQALASGKKEDGGDKDVGLGAEREIEARGIEVKGYGEDEQEAQGVRPYVHQLIRYAEGGPHATKLGFGEAIPAEDVRVDTPGHR